MEKTKTSYDDVICRDNSDYLHVDNEPGSAGCLSHSELNHLTDKDLTRFIADAVDVNQESNASALKRRVSPDYAAGVLLWINSTKRADFWKNITRFNPEIGREIFQQFAKNHPAVAAYDLKDGSTWRGFARNEDIQTDITLLKALPDNTRKEVISYFSNSKSTFDRDYADRLIKMNPDWIEPRQNTDYQVPPAPIQKNFETDTTLKYTRK